MCIFGKTAKPDAPQLPVEYAAQRAPTQQGTADAATRTQDRIRAATATVLTGTNGVGAVDQSGKKTLLGA